MRKDILLPGLALLGGGLGFGLRLWQRSQGYDPIALLFNHRHPAALLLLTLSAALFLVFALLLRDLRGPTEPAAALHCPSSVYMAGMAVSGLLFLVSGVLGLLERMGQLALWRFDPETNPLTYPITLILCALLALSAGPATLMLGKCACRNSFVPRCSLLVLFPPLTALAWLFSTHLAHSTDPILMDYGFLLAAVALLMLAHYFIAAQFHDRPRPRLAVLCALMGCVCGLIALADRPSLFQTGLILAFLLSALSHSFALLRNSFGPPWPKRLLEQRAASDPGQTSDSANDW